MKKIFISFLFLIFSSVTSYANQFYAGIDIAQISMDTGITNISANLDEDDTLMKFTGGYNVNENVSVEAFYLDGGQVSLSGVSGNQFILSGTTYTFSATATIYITADTMGVGGKYNFYKSENKKTSAYLLGGMHSWDVVVGASSATSSAKITTTGTDPYYGFGANYAISENLKANISYQNYEFDNDGVDGFALGLEYDF
jgi:hypothetical protein